MTPAGQAIIVKRCPVRKRSSRDLLVFYQPRSSASAPGNALYHPPSARGGGIEVFKQQLVLILASEFKTEDDRGYVIPDVVQAGAVYSEASDST